MRISSLSFTLFFPAIAALSSAQAQTYATVVQVNPGHKTHYVQEYSCENHLVVERRADSSSKRLQRAIIGGAIGYGLGHNSQYRGEIAGTAALLGLAKTHAPQSIEKRVCGNKTVAKTYTWGYQLVLDYNGSQQSVYSETAYEIGDNYPIQVSWTPAQL